MPKGLTQTIRDLLKGRTHYPGHVTSIAGEYCSVRLSDTGATLNNLAVVGVMPVVGDKVYVDFRTDPPVVVSSRLQVAQTQRAQQQEISRAQNARALMLQAIGVEDLWGGIRRYSSAGVLGGVYPTSGSGFDMALHDADVDDIIHIPPCTIGGDHQINGHFHIVGFSTQSTIFTGSLENTGAELENFSIFCSGSSGSPGTSGSPSAIGLVFSGICRMKNVNITMTGEPGELVPCAMAMTPQSSLRASHCKFKSTSHGFYSRKALGVTAEVVKTSLVQYTAGSPGYTESANGLGGFRFRGMTPWMVRQLGDPTYRYAKGQNYAIIKLHLDLSDEDIWTLPAVVNYSYPSLNKDPQPFTRGTLRIDFATSGALQESYPAKTWRAIAGPPLNLNSPYNRYNIWPFDPTMAQPELLGYVPSLEYNPSWYGDYLGNGSINFGSYPLYYYDYEGPETLDDDLQNVRYFDSTGKYFGFLSQGISSSSSKRIVNKGDPPLDIYIAIAEPTIRFEDLRVVIHSVSLVSSYTAMAGTAVTFARSKFLYQMGIGINGGEYIYPISWSSRGHRNNVWSANYIHNGIPDLGGGLAQERIDVFPISENHFFNCVFECDGYDMSAESGVICYVNNCVFDEAVGDIRYEQGAYEGVVW